MYRIGDAYDGVSAYVADAELVAESLTREQLTEATDNDLHILSVTVTANKL